MIKQVRVVVNGKVTVTTLECYSWDGGKSFSSSPVATLAFLRRRKKVLDTRLSERELRWLDKLSFPEADAEHDVRGAMRVR